MSDLQFPTIRDALAAHDLAAALILETIHPDEPAIRRYCPDCRTVTVHAYRLHYTICTVCDAPIGHPGTVTVQEQPLF